MVVEVLVVRSCFALLAVVAFVIFGRGVLGGSSTYIIVAALMITAILVGLASFNTIIQ